jgi:hypothetical protein
MNIQEAFEKFKNVPFPDNSSFSEELADIFYELIDYDSFVAGQIDSYIGNKNYVVLEYDPDLEERIILFLTKVGKEDIDVKPAHDLLAYLKEIERLISEAKKSQ